jgi:glycosyltransferase involved in cell wall biosynthesis
MWPVGVRPVPPNVTWVGNLSEHDSDVLILGVDQWSLEDPAKRYQFLHFKESFAGPKIVINHGCNMVDGCSSEAMAELVNGCYMVCNSSTAHDLWGIADSRFIRHGMSPEEWPSSYYASNRTVVVQPYTRAYARYRNHEGIARAEEAGVVLAWVGRDLAFSSFNQYRHFLRESSIFFNPSYASPNPRARTEAMLMGLAVVTTNSHGEDEYIENGVNGFCSNDFEELVSFLLHLQAHREEVRMMGMAGRATAQERFGISGFVEQWNVLLAEYVGAPPMRP